MPGASPVPQEAVKLTEIIEAQRKLLALVDQLKSTARSKAPAAEIKDELAKIKVILDQQQAMRDTVMSMPKSTWRMERAPSIAQQGSSLRITGRTPPPQMVRKASSTTQARVQEPPSAVVALLTSISQQLSRLTDQLTPTPARRTAAFVPPRTPSAPVFPARRMVNRVATTPHLPDYTATGYCSARARFSPSRSVRHVACVDQCARPSEAHARYTCPHVQHEEFAAACSRPEARPNSPTRDVMAARKPWAHNPARPESHELLHSLNRPDLHHDSPSNPAARRPNSPDPVPRRSVNYHADAAGAPAPRVTVCEYPADSPRDVTAITGQRLSVASSQAVWAPRGRGLPDLSALDVDFEQACELLETGATVTSTGDASGTWFCKGVPDLDALLVFRSSEDAPVSWAVSFADLRSAFWDGELVQLVLERPEHQSAAVIDMCENPYFFIGLLLLVKLICDSEPPPSEFAVSAYY